ncbi:MAG TPA: hypothetical protein VLA23_05530 [Candidatus Limnocylindrales bacterium]|nr:hypothetical protein [Candidatus Limnocylindrales bacterium]
MPFNPFKRKKEPPPVQAEAAPRGRDLPGRPVPFDGLTEEWHLVGTMHIEGRLSDILNRREPIAISGVSWGSSDGKGPLEAAPGLEAVDPYDLIIVMTGGDSLPELSDAEKAAFRVHKIPYDLALEAPPFRVVGTVHLYPGAEPERLLDRSTEMFIAATDATAFHGDDRLTDDAVDTILVNRFYLRGIQQVDRRTGERVQPLPGQPLGGISWRDRSR